MARKFDSSRFPRRSPGRPATEAEIEQNILKFAQENKSWGYKRIAAALKNLGLEVCSSTVANVMKRNGLNPSGDRKKGGMSWAEFLKIQKDAIWATDFLTSEVWTPFGLTTFYILFFIQIKTRKVVLGGITAHPTGEWMAQVAKNLTGFDGELAEAKYLIHDRDVKYTAQFDAILKGSGVKPVKLPPFSPNLNSFSERFVLSLKSECLDKFIPIGERSLRRAVKNYLEHYHSERNHQGIGNCIPFPEGQFGSREGKLKTKQRLGGLLKYYYRDQDAA